MIVSTTAMADQRPKAQVLSPELIQKMGKQRDCMEWVGGGDKAEREAEERVAAAKIVMAARKRAEQRLMDLKRVRSSSPNRPRSRSISAPPRDVFKRPCWSIHSRTHRTKRDELIEMGIEMMTSHRLAKNLLITSDFLTARDQG